MNGWDMSKNFLARLIAHIAAKESFERKEFMVLAYCTKVSWLQAQKNVNCFVEEEEDEGKKKLEKKSWSS